MFGLDVNLLELAANLKVGLFRPLAARFILNVNLLELAANLIVLFFIFWFLFDSRFISSPDVSHCDVR